MKRAAAYVLSVILRLLHPVMPFVTEELWDRLGYGAPYSLIRAPWPVPFAVPESVHATVEIRWPMRFIQEVRAIRATYRVPPSARVPVVIGPGLPGSFERGQQWFDEISRLARVRELRPFDGNVPADSAHGSIEGANIYVLLGGLIDLDAERGRLENERAKVSREAQALHRKLENANFVARADPDVVQETRERLAAAEAEVVRLQAALDRIG